jgi:hypothetical protein
MRRLARVRAALTTAAGLAVTTVTNRGYGITKDAARVYGFDDSKIFSCYDSEPGPVTTPVPPALHEIGVNDCAHGFVGSLMDRADQRGAGYPGWTRDTRDCAPRPAPVAGHGGAPADVRVRLENRLAQVP